MKSGPIGLLSDFGLHDWYVGVMKAVILGINPHATVVDIVHNIPPQDVAAGSFALLASYRFLPEGSILVAVIDPGVGTQRRIICANSANRCFLAPDNGVLGEVLAKEGYQRLISVENHRFFLEPLSLTFHGRDVFAPVAAHLSKGLPMDQLGREIADYKRIRSPGPLIMGDRAVLTVRWVDAFGNLITDCPEELLAELRHRWDGVVVVAGQGRQADLVDSYQSQAPGAVLGIVGSSGYLEVSVREGSASQNLGLTLGSNIELRRP